MFATEHRQWFASVFATNRAERASRIDPYQSSSRDAQSLYRKLESVEAGLPLITQEISDVSGAALIERGTGVMLPFGRRMLDDWRRLGISSGDAGFEVALAAALIRAGLDEQVPLYIDLYDRWLGLVALQPAAYWLTSKWRLTLPEYLNQARNGFNPFAVMAATNGGQVGDKPEWDAWAAADATMAAPIRRLAAKVDSRRGRVEFCQALELIRLSETDPDALVPTLTTWSV